MRKFYFIIIIFFIGVSLYAQTDAISYQAVILNPQKQELPGVNAEENIFPNKTIKMRFTIIDSNGSATYQETQTTTTDAYGIVNLFIGEGSQTSTQSFDEINWDGTSKKLKVEIDFNGGNSFVNLGTQNLTFTPYAYHRDIIASGNLTIDGKTILKDDLSIEGATVLNDNLTVKGETTLDDKVSVNGVTNLNDDVTIDGITNLSKDLNVNNGSTTNLSGDLAVDGETTFKNGLNINGTTVLNDNLTVKGETNLEYNMSVTGESTFDGKVALKGAMDVDGQTNLRNNLTVDGDAFLNQNMSVVGISTFDGKVALKGAMDVDGQTSLRNNLTVDGDVLLNQNMSVVGISIFDGKVALKGAMDVDGQTNLRNNLTVDGDAILNQNISVVGTSTLEGKVALKGAMDVDGQTNLRNNLTVDGDAFLNQSMTVVGTSTLEGKVALKGDVDVDGQMNLHNNLIVEGVTNLKGTFSVVDGKVTSLSGYLFVDGVTNLKSDLNVINGSQTNLTGNLNVGGNILLEKDLTVKGAATFESDLTMKKLVVSGEGGAYGDHVALFENTSTSNTADGIAIRIHGNASGKLGFRNRFITFYGSANGGSYMAGRIESYDLLAGDLWESFPIPDFANLIDVFDFTQVLEWTPPSLTFNPGSLPSLNGGQLPWVNWNNGSSPSLSVNWEELSYSWNNGDLPSLTFNPGSFPTLNSGALPSGSLDIGSLNLNFDNFFNPTAGTNALDDISAMVAWGVRNGDPGFMPTGPWGIALVPLVLAAKQAARDQGVIYGSKGADYAEWLEKENPKEKYMFGEVVGVKGGKISRNTTNADQVMSISLAPIVLGNMPDEDRKDAFEKVGFMGQVPVLTLGDVKIGDYIVASGYNDGYAKAISEKDITLKDFKNIIGRAWTGSEGKKASLINVSVGLKTNEWVEIMKQQENRLDKLELKIKKLENLINNMNTL
ncbi:hypothetical protein Lupro_11365 [Lutibacter profundi]|uniref:Peptidase S74 domain-containing protein n=1 Tax=Lutibacter profundi TaxID=1622118 RepID=A0A0X8G892_9FLAO|nr:hypothetical protein [Lutibacter profundi]AMC11826.1 hypothetical protein Lupro_11365 [Lutibacter profundi]